MNLGLDRIDLILISLIVTLGIITPLPYYFYIYVRQVSFVAYWTFINWVIEGLGVLALLAFAGYRIHKRSHEMSPTRT